MAKKKISLPLVETNILDQKIIVYLDRIRGDKSYTSTVKSILLMVMARDELKLELQDTPEKTQAEYFDSSLIDSALVNPVAAHQANDEIENDDEEDEDEENWFGRLIHWLYDRYGLKGS